MIRNILPMLTAAEITGIQPMGLGPPVCDACMVLGLLTEHKEFPWKCACCGSVDLERNLHAFIQPTQDLIRARTNLIKDREIMDFGNYIYRKFMFLNDPREPNDRYREWLEEKIGKQGETWDWEINQGPDMDAWNKLRLTFLRHEDAILFELSCS